MQHEKYITPYPLCPPFKVLVMTYVSMGSNLKSRSIIEMNGAHCAISRKSLSSNSQYIFDHQQTRGEWGGGGGGG